MPRIARIVYPNYPHHIIQRGNNRQQVFFDIHDRHLYLKLLKKFTTELSCQVIAYCLMSNHIHLLLVPPYINYLSKAMQKISLVFTQHVNKKYARSGRLWECRFHSCPVDREKYLWTVCRYIERNPVRAGIVSNPFEYPWSSVHGSAGSKKDNVISQLRQDYCDSEEYARFLAEPEREKDVCKIRKTVYSGRLLSDE